MVAPEVNDLEWCWWCERCHVGCALGQSADGKCTVCKHPMSRHHFPSQPVVVVKGTPAQVIREWERLANEDRRPH